MEEVKVFTAYTRPFCYRVIWALKMKGIDFEVVEEDLKNKSPLLLKYNPLHNKVPVLLHRGNPIPESLIILEYIDETWKENPLLPQCPLERASARVWARFLDSELWDTLANVFITEGEEQEKAIAPALKSLEKLDHLLKGKKFFGGETIGYADLAAGWIPYWQPVVEEAAGVKMMEARRFPSLCEWCDYFLEVPVIKENLPDLHDMLTSLQDTRFALLSKNKN